MTHVLARPDDAAARFLARWNRHEARLHSDLQTGSPKAQRSAIGRTLTHFRVIRSLKRSAEDALGLPRFEPVRECLAAITPQDATDDRFVPVTVFFARAVALRYGGKSFLSLASKLLWMKFRDPFVIYDSIVRTALGTREGDYHTYVAAWLEQYSLHRSSIKLECDLLATSHEVAGEEWFTRRVLDFMLLGGAPTASSKRPA